MINVALLLSTERCGGARLVYNQLTGTIPPEVANAFPPASITWAFNCIQGSGSPVSSCSMPDRIALVALYVAATGIRWATEDKWLSLSDSPCTWYGVGCDAAGTYVQ